MGQYYLVVNKTKKEYKDISLDVIKALQVDDIIGEFRKW